MTPVVAVLASGRGTNLQALLDDEVVAAALAVVVSDRADAGALDRAGARGVEALLHDPAGFSSREEHDVALVEVLRGLGVEVVCLAGYMRILTTAFVRAFWPRIVNVHPSLLPAFPGAHAVRDALAWGVRVTGCTVHLVDEQVDHGPIVAQEAVDVRPGDSVESLHERIKAVEHRLLPACVRLFCEGRLVVEGRCVRVTG